MCYTTATNADFIAQIGRIIGLVEAGVLEHGEVFEES
jgi:hypothetical protein